MRERRSTERGSSRWMNEAMTPCGEEDKKRVEHLFKVSQCDRMPKLIPQVFSEIEFRKGGEAFPHSLRRIKIDL